MLTTAVVDVDVPDPEDVAPESTSRWMALLFGGTLVWRFPATTSTCRGGSAARSVLAEKGASVAAGAVGVDGLGSRFEVAPVTGAAAVLLLSFPLLRLLRTVASCSSPLGGNQKSQSLRITAARATSNIASAMRIRFRCTSGSCDAGREGSGVALSSWFSGWVSS